MLLIEHYEKLWATRASAWISLSCVPAPVAHHNTAAPNGGGGTLLPSQATGKKAECNLGHEAFFLLVTVSEETS